MAEDQQFAEMLINNRVGDQDDLQTASETLGYASTAMIKMFYHNKLTVVLSLPYKSGR